MSTINVLDAAGATVAVQLPNADGQTNMANSRPVVIASDQTAISVGQTGTEYETVAASQTNQVLGATGALNDLLVAVMIIPASTSPGAVTIKDGSNAAITVFAGGASSVSNLVPFSVPLNIRSIQGAWQVTTGASVSAIGIGDFT